MLINYYNIVSQLYFNFFKDRKNLNPEELKE